MYDSTLVNAAPALAGFGKYEYRTTLVPISTASYSPYLVSSDDVAAAAVAAAAPLKLTQNTLFHRFHRRSRATPPRHLSTLLDFRHHSTPRVDADAVYKR